MIYWQHDLFVVVDAAALKAAGIIKKDTLPVKVLGNGDIKTAVTVTVDAFSKSAIAKIEALTKEALIDIVTKPKNAFVKQYKSKKRFRRFLWWI